MENITGIKLEDIGVKRETKGDMVYHKARLSLTVQQEMSLRMVDLKNRQDQDDYLYHILRQKILAHIYGNLIRPINQLANIAQANINADDVLIQKLREEIGAILNGKEESKIIMQ